jgi:hypothetical protein
MADPEEYRTREQVAEWRRRDPISLWAARLVEEGVLDEAAVEESDADAVAKVDEAVAFADDSPFPAPESLYDNVYSLGDQLRGWYSVDERGPEAHKGEDERQMDRGDVPGLEQYERHVASAQEGVDERPSDEAQAEDEQASEAEGRSHDGERGG